MPTLELVTAGIAAVLMPSLNRTSDDYGGRVRCASDLGQIGQGGVEMYANENRALSRRTSPHCC